MLLLLLLLLLLASSLLHVVVGGFMRPRLPVDQQIALIGSCGLCTFQCNPRCVVYTDPQQMCSLDYNIYTSHDLA